MAVHHQSNLRRRISDEVWEVVCCSVKWVGACAEFPGAHQSHSEIFHQALWRAGDWFLNYLREIVWQVGVVCFVKASAVGSVAHSMPCATAQPRLDALVLTSIVSEASFLCQFHSFVSLFKKLFSVCFSSLFWISLKKTQTTKNAPTEHVPLHCYRDHGGLVWFLLKKAHIVHCHCWNQ